MAHGLETAGQLRGAPTFNVGSSVRIARAIEEYTPMFLEEPVPPENVEAMLEAPGLGLRGFTPAFVRDHMVELATAERETSGAP